MNNRSDEAARAAIELLLAALEAHQPILSGAVMQLSPAAADRLKKMGFLRSYGDEVESALGNEEDVPVDLIAHPRGGLAYLSRSAGLVSVPREQLERFEINFPAVMREIARSAGVSRTASPLELRASRVWELGTARQRGKKPLSLWFARRLWDDDFCATLEDALSSRPHPALRVVLTSSSSERLGSVSLPGAVIVPLWDVLAMAGNIAVDPAILFARIGSASQRNPMVPLALSDDGRELRINGGPPLEFRTDPQSTAIRQLVDAYQTGKRLRVSELTHLGSLNRLFGAKKWARLCPYLKSIDGRWGFEL